MAEKRSSAIVCCRTASMLMIVLCHIICYYPFIPGYNYLGDILDSGVYSFLAISGYLYGRKSISSFDHWFRRRYLTVALPATLLFLAVLTAEFCVGNHHSPIIILAYLLNLQGLGFLYGKFYRFFSEILVLGPLWFVTIISLCYCLVPFLQKYRERFRAWKYSFACILCTVPICYFLAVSSGFNVVHLLTFAIGYYLSAKNTLQPTRLSRFALYSGVMLAFQILRLVLMAVCDGTAIYHNYATYSHMVLDIWILYFFFAFEQYFPAVTDWLANSRPITVGSDLSLYVYMTHFCFCRGPLNCFLLTNNLFLASVAFLMATLIAALLLKKATEIVQTFLTSHFFPTV